MDREALIRRIENLERTVSQLEEKRDLYNIINNSVIGVYRTTPAGRIVRANKRMVEMLGYDSLEELSELDVENSGYHSDYSRDHFKTAIEANGYIVGYEAGWLKKDGSIILIKESAWIVRDASGEIIFYDGICEDVTQWKMTEYRMREDKKKYEILVESGNDGIVIIKDGLLKYVNRRILQMSGYKKEDALGQPFWTFVPEHRRAALRENYNRRVDGKPVPARYETEISSQSGTNIPVELSASVIEIDGSKADMAIIRDISQQKMAEKKLQNSLRKIEQLHEVVHPLSSSHTAEEIYRLGIDAAERILNLTWCDLSIEKAGILIPCVTSKPVPPGISRIMSINDGYAGETYRSGRTLMLDNIDPSRNALAESTGLKSLISAPIPDVGVFQAFSTDAFAFSQEDVKLVDILMGHVAEALKRVNLQNELIEQATRDSLTGAFNRHYLHQKMDREINRCKRYNHCMAVIMIDINRFKEINDTFGHQIGDKVLIAVAGCLMETVRECDVVIRYGGDEFLVILPETSDELLSVRDRILDAITHKIAIPELKGFPVTLSVGMSVWNPQEDLVFDEVINQADGEMYRVKRLQNGQGR